MEGAFTHLGNHLVSDSAAAINAGDDDLSNLDPDESLLYPKYAGRGGLGNARRRNDDDDNDQSLCAQEHRRRMDSDCHIDYSILIRMSSLPLILPPSSLSP